MLSIKRALLFPLVYFLYGIIVLLLLPLRGLFWATHFLQRGRVRPGILRTLESFIFGCGTYLAVEWLRPALRSIMAPGPTHIVVIFNGFTRITPEPEDARRAEVTSTLRTSATFDTQATTTLFGCLEYFTATQPEPPGQPIPIDLQPPSIAPDKHVVAFCLKSPRNLRDEWMDTLDCTGIRGIQGGYITWPTFLSLRGESQSSSSHTQPSPSSSPLISPLSHLLSHPAPPGLAMFDMDSTLIQSETIDELASAMGPDIEDKVSAITASAMRGELDFSASLRERVSLLNGVPVSIWDDLKRRVRITPGARALIRSLKKLGYTTAVVSGGFLPLATWLKDELGMDHVYANALLVDETTQTLTGELDPSVPTVDGNRKRDILLSLRESLGVHPARVIAVGDGANDIPMLRAAGLGVAFNAKPAVKSAAQWSDRSIAGGVALDAGSIRDILYYLGLTYAEQEELSRVQGDGKKDGARVEVSEVEES